MLRDITERYWMQQQVARHEQELEALVARRTAQLTRANEQLRLEIEERERREVEIRQRTEDLALMNGVHDAMNRGLGLAETAKLMVQGLHRVFQGVGAAVYLLSEYGQSLTECALALSDNLMGAVEALTVVKRPPLHVPITDHSLLGDVLLDRQPRLLDTPAMVKRLMEGYLDAVPDERARRAASAALPRIMATLAIRSVLVVPLMSEGVGIGLVVLAHRERLTGADLARLEAMAGQLTSAIRHGRMAEALQQSEAHYRGLFEGVPVGLYRTTPDGRVLDVNPALARMLGYPDQGSLLTMDVADLYADPQDRRRWQALMEHEGQVAGAELQFRRADGTLMWVRDTARAVRDAAGRVRYYEGSLEDLRDFELAHAALIEAEKLSAAHRLAASIAHEINNPLQAVIGCLGLAREMAPRTETVGRCLETADRELQRVVRTVARLRNLTRPASPEEKGPTDLHGLVEDLVALIQPWCDERHVELQRQLHAPALSVSLARDRMQQALLNLALNAVDAMPEGGVLTIRVAATEDPPGAQIDVGDTGTGIAPDVLPHLFEPFRTTKLEGLGLGLYVARNTVRDHGGDIQVTSAPGRGTTFTVWLPT
jgi:PAS domain S-box-containing protein